MSVSNNYTKAVEVDGCLFAVQLSDGGWSVADGPGTALCETDERELAGWHLPVRFETEDTAAMAIHSGPHEMFDIERDSAWVLHCLAAGAAPCEAYARA